MRKHIEHRGGRVIDATVELLLQLEHHERVVDHGEIFERLHPLGEGSCGGEDELQHHLSAFREVLGPSAVAIVPGRGWKFGGLLANPPAPVVLAPASAHAPAAPRKTRLARTLSNKAELLARVNKFDDAVDAQNEAQALEAPRWPATERAFLALHAGNMSQRRRA
jgi:hypothetical protein